MGSITRQTIASSDMPSIRAASIRSSGTVIKNWRIRKIKPLVSCISSWHIASLVHPRAAQLDLLKNALKKNSIRERSIYSYASISEAYHHVVSGCKSDEMVLVFGSFQTVSEVKQVEEVEYEENRSSE